MSKKKNSKNKNNKGKSSSKVNKTNNDIKIEKLNNDKTNGKEELLNEEYRKKRKKFCLFFLIWVCILAIGLVRKPLQNDTFYTIKIGELILDNGIDMMDHFSFHSNLPYTYPHWLYDVFIYLVYAVGGFVGIHISSVILFLILLILVFKTNKKISNDVFVSAFALFICALAVSSFVTARAQLASFLVFVLQIYFIESFLQNGKKKYLFGLLFLSLILCNIHVAVWPFYFILYLPYLSEYAVSYIASKIKIKKDNKFTLFLKRKFVFEKNKNIKYIFSIMIASLLTGLITPIGDTPYTYLIKTMLGNSQNYITEHQMLSWMNSPFTIIIAFETLFLSVFSKAKLRDFFMICGLVLMSIVSTRHLSLLALIGTICYARLFSMFLDNFNIKFEKKFVNFFSKKMVSVISFLIVIVFSSIMLNHQLKKDFLDEKFYPIEATKYIKENLDTKNMKIFNEYNFGSYLLFYDIPVYIDSRADLYTKQFSGFERDIFDDFYYLLPSYEDKFNYYDITHVMLYKKQTEFFCDLLKDNDNYKILYEDDYYVLFERLEDDVITVKVN